MKKADLDTVRKDISGLEEIFKKAKAYNDKAIDYSKHSMNLRNPSAIDGLPQDIRFRHILQGHL